jgi:hypothetical protein
VFLLSPSVRERGFGVATFCFESAQPAGDKTPGLPVNSPPIAVLQGRKS